MNRKLLFLGSFFLLIILLLRMVTFFTGVKSYNEGQEIAFITQIQSEPQAGATGQKISLIAPNHQRISVTFPQTSALGYGDRLKIQGIIRYFVSKNGSRIAFIKEPEFEILAAESKTNFIYLLRNRVISFFQKSMNRTDSSLMLGIVFGIKEPMSRPFYDDFRKAGLLHVIAASGMNISLSAGFFLSIFSLFLRRQLALFLSIFGIFLYTFLAGFEPSIVRAAIMGVLTFAAQILGRQNSAPIGLVSAGFIMLFFNPSLILDVGFQLSFLATTALIYISPIFFLFRRLRLLIEKSVVGGDIATTISAQIITLPILLINFGSYSPISILANALVLWTIPILMFLGGISAFIGIVFEPLGHILNYLSLPFLAYFEASFGENRAFGA